MTKRQNMNLVLGIALLAVGIVVSVVLKTMEGSIVIKDGQESAYSVDPLVYVIMSGIALIGAMIVVLTVTEGRWPSRNNEKEAGVADLRHEKRMTPAQKAKMRREGVSDPEKHRSKRKNGRPAEETAPQQSKSRKSETVKDTGSAIAQDNELEIPSAKPAEPVDNKEIMLMTKTEPEPVIEAEVGPAQAIAGPAEVSDAESAVAPAAEPVKSERYVPLKVEAIGRCPMCGKVVVIGSPECFKCGWKVVPENLVGFDD
jgi:hypothetical protein